MKTENSFELELERKISKKQFGDVLESLLNPDNELFIKTNVWNIINTVCLTLKTKELLESDSDLQLCKNILLNLVDRGNPKEVIVALMEEADSFKSHEYFCLLLDPLRQTLKRVPGKRGKSLEWVLSTLNAHIRTLSLPKDLDLQGEEKLLLDTDPAVIDANYVLSGYLKFLEAFVEEVSFKNTSAKCYIERVEHQRDILQKFILILFDHPFLYHDLHVTDSAKPKSTIRTLCESYVMALSKICGNVFNLFRFERFKVDVDSEDCDRVPALALSNLAYLIFVEKLATCFRPFVLSPLHVFEKHLKYVNLLLSKKENLILFKALHLAKTLLQGLEDLTITYDFMEVENSTEFPRLLVKLAVFSQIETHRKVAVEVFRLYLTKWDWKGRYHVLVQTLVIANHSGVEGLAISMYKTYLHECLCGKAKDTYFLGNNMKLFLKKVVVLKDGVETDILENSDRIMAATNFLRYLLLRDRREENLTGIWDLVDYISVKFVEPLSIGLELSRAHYKQVAKDHEYARKNLLKDVSMSVTVNNETLPTAPPHFEKELCIKALLMFDLIESTLSRVRELM